MNVKVARSPADIRKSAIVVKFSLRSGTMVRRSTRSGPAMAEIGNADATVLKTTTYLERKDGKRVFLMDYLAPIQDGLGAKFVFPRMVDGKPFVDTNSGEVRFSTEVGKAVKISKRFKVNEMMYDGKLEY